jgi:hypothetical protein
MSIFTRRSIPRAAAIGPAYIAMRSEIQLSLTVGGRSVYFRTEVLAISGRLLSYTPERHGDETEITPRLGWF